MERRTDRTKEKMGWRISYWNVADLRNKDKGFWNNLKWWEVIIMSETWIEKSG